jgi:hypothetical protein
MMVVILAALNKSRTTTRVVNKDETTSLNYNRGHNDDDDPDRTNSSDTNQGDLERANNDAAGGCWNRARTRRIPPAPVG